MLKKIMIGFLFLSNLFLPTTTEIESFSIEITRDYLGILSIPKIHLKEPFYEMNSIENTIEKHVSLIQEATSPKEENSLILLAAHSGTGPLAYFERLDELTIGDEIYLTYQDEKFTYIVKDIWEEKKTGKIHIQREINNQLILTTCHPKKESFQLIMNCIKKESN